MCCARCIFAQGLDSFHFRRRFHYFVINKPLNKKGRTDWGSRYAKSISSEFKAWFEE
jgi:hypothetical protein